MCTSVTWLLVGPSANMESNWLELLSFQLLIFLLPPFSPFPPHPPPLPISSCNSPPHNLSFPTIFSPPASTFPCKIFPSYPPIILPVPLSRPSFPISPTSRTLSPSIQRPTFSFQTQTSTLCATRFWSMLARSSRNPKRTSSPKNSLSCSQKILSRELWR